MELSLNQCQNCGASLKPTRDGVKLCNYCGSSYNESIIDIEKINTPYIDYSISNSLLLQLPPPSRLKVFTSYLPKGMAVWIGWGVVRAIILAILGPEYAIDGNYNDVLFFSHIGTPLYFLGGAILVLSLPLYHSTIGYKKIKVDSQKIKAKFE